jgi:hypothetical protein
LNLDGARTESATAWRRFHQELLHLRAREIVPRLRRLAAGGSGFDLLGERALRACWRLDDGASLTILTNMSDTPVSGVPTPPGRLLYATPAPMPGGFDGVLPGWSALWFLEELTETHR